MARPLPHLSYDELNRRLMRHGNKPLKIAHNTYASRHLIESTILIHLHRNEIVRLYEDGQLWMSDAGWPTQTTVRRLNAFVPRGHCVCIRKGRTWMVTPDNQRIPLG